MDFNKHTAKGLPLLSKRFRFSLFNLGQPRLLFSLSLQPPHMFSSFPHSIFRYEQRAIGLPFSRLGLAQTLCCGCNGWIM